MNNNIEKIIHLMQTDNSEDAPEDAVRWSKNLFRSRIAEIRPGIVERVVAVLRQELAPGTAAIGERSTGGGRARQMLFDAGDITVDLRVVQSGDRFRVKGQLLGEGVENALINLGDQESKLNSFGEFKFEEVNAGAYQIVILLSGKEVVIENVQVG